MCNNNQGVIVMKFSLSFTKDKRNYLLDFDRGNVSISDDPSKVIHTIPACPFFEFAANIRESGYTDSDLIDLLDYGLSMTGAEIWLIEGLLSKSVELVSPLIEFAGEAV